MAVSARPLRHSVTRSLRHFAFTLIELICVMVILSVIAGMIVPRILNTRARAAENESREVQRLLNVAGEKAALWSLPVAINYADGKLELWTRRADGGTASDAVGAASGRWIVDPGAESVTLVNTRIKQATADGVVLPGGKWRIEFAPGQPRPAVGIALESVANAAAGWQVSLDSDANGATRQATGAGGDRGAAIARSIDLDDAGKGTAPW